MARPRAWLALFRPPNFFTVPGDVLAGYFLAGGMVLGRLELWLALGASASLYGAGLLLNDWADADVDRVERPERPIPAALVGRNTVFAWSVVLLAAGLLLCFLAGRPVLMAGAVLAACVGNYNLLTKSIPLIGALNMGLCRGLNVALGAAVVAGLDLPVLAWWGAGTILAYIAAVTHLARTETIGRYNTVERWLPAAVLTAAFFFYLPLSPLLYRLGQFAVPVLFGVAVVGAARVALQLPDRLGSTPTDGLRPPMPVPPMIGRLIGLLIPLQCAFIVGSGDGVWRIMVALAILLLWPLKRWAGRIFYSS